MKKDPEMQAMEESSVTPMVSATGSIEGWVMSTEVAGKVFNAYFQEYLPACRSLYEWRENRVTDLKKEIALQ